MPVLIGSARHDENGKYIGGKAGDQTGTEVSLQNFYLHSKGWVILRAKDVNLANGLAFCMYVACGNENIGYDQGNRLAIMKDTICSQVPTECDCSSLVRACLKQCGVEVANFTTANAAAVLVNSGLFDKVAFTNQSELCNGDILCTQSKGHIVIVVSGAKERGGNKPAVARPTIKNGSRGVEAKNLQLDLNYLGENLATDGIIGTKSVEAIKRFQRKYYLTCDGIYGNKSYQKMKSLI